MEDATPFGDASLLDADGVLERWRASTIKQEVLLNAILKENKDLKQRLQSLELENYSFRTTIQAMKASEEESSKAKELLQTEISNASQRISQLEGDSNLVLALLDGDGYIFTKELLSQGESGGREAASRLSTGILHHLREQPNFPSNPILWTMIFLSKDRLEHVLSKSDTCNPHQFKHFIKGFSQAHPLFSFVEVGLSKEAADYKIKDHMNKFIGIHKVYKVVVGVDHDNGYSAAIAAELTAGFKEKLILLRAHNVVARDISSLTLATFSIDGLFMPDKITICDTSSPRIVDNYNQNSLGLVPESLPSRLAAHNNPGNGSSTTSSPRTREAKLPKLDPPACNLFYITGKCNNIEKCKFGHYYQLSDAQIKQLATGAKKQPCKYMNEGKACHLENCIFGHACPQGARCSFLAAGKCKFRGPTMHNV